VSRAGLKLESVDENAIVLLKYLSRLQHRALESITVLISFNML
jgi:hypothetical protein